MSVVLGIIKRRLKKIVTKVYNPLVDLKIGNQKIKIPYSHALTEAITRYPNLNFNLGRLVNYAVQKSNDVKVIDIGANVGDSVAYIKNFVDIPILCIDGEEKYVNILKENIKKYNNVYVCLTLVGNETTEKKVKLKSERGTAFIVESDVAVKMQTLEDILNEFPQFKDSKFLKLDTDGYDLHILKGSKGYLKKKLPILF